MNRLLVVLTLCFNAVCAASAQAVNASANVYQLTDEDMQIISKSQDFMRGETEQGEPLSFDFGPDIKLDDFANAGQYQKAQKEARELAGQIIDKLQKAPMFSADMKFDQDEQTPTPQPYKEHSTLVFASLSLGEQGLRDLLSMTSGLDDAVVVFRGIHRGESMTDALTRLQRMAAQHDPMPTVIINPDLFRSYNVTVVPTIVNVDTQDLPVAGDIAKPVARVAGISNPLWLNKAIERGETGDLGIKGPVLDISEVDLIELAKERVAEIDWEEKKKQAVERFWTKQNFNELPRAPKSRTREIDPSVMITRDISTPDGTVFAHAGDVINPLCDPKEVCKPGTRPFTQAVVVFDPLDKKQMELLAKKLPEIMQKPGVQRITYIATEFDKDKGWDSYKSVTDNFDAPVYLLTPDLITRFELEYVPSIITAQGKRFVVEELADRRAE